MRRRKRVNASDAGVDRDHVLLSLGSVDAELNTHLAPGQIQDIGEGIAVFVILVFGGTLAAHSRQRGQAAMKQAGQSQFGVEVLAGLRIPLGRRRIGEVAACEVQPEIVHQGGRNHARVGEQRLLGIAVVGLVGGGRRRRHLGLNDGRGCIAEADMVLLCEELVDLDGEPFFVRREQPRVIQVKNVTVGADIEGAGRRIVRQRLGVGRIDHRCRNDVAGERRVSLAGGGRRHGDELIVVHDRILVVKSSHACARQVVLGGHVRRQGSRRRNDGIAPVSRAFGGGRQQRVLRQEVPPPVRLEGRKPKGLVLAVVELRNVNRAAGREGALIVFQRGWGPVDGSQGKGPGGEGGVAVVPQRRAVELVGARFCGGIDDAAAAGSVLRGVGTGLNRELLNGFGRETHHGTREADARVIGAIRQKLSTERPSAVYAQSAPRTGSDARHYPVLAARVARSVGLRQGQIEHAAVHQRQVVDLALCDHAVGGSRFGVHHGRAGLHFHRGRNRSGLER